MNRLSLRSCSYNQPASYSWPAQSSFSCPSSNNPVSGLLNVLSFRRIINLYNLIKPRFSSQCVTPYLVMYLVKVNQAIISLVVLVSVVQSHKVCQLHTWTSGSPAASSLRPSCAPSTRHHPSCHSDTHNPTLSNCSSDKHFSPHSCSNYSWFS